MSVRERALRVRAASTRYLRLIRWLVDVERQLIGHAWQYAGVSGDGVDVSGAPASNPAPSKVARSNAAPSKTAPLKTPGVGGGQSIEAGAEKANQKAADFARLNRAWAQALVELMQENGGTWIKVGQFLSCRPDILPPEFIEVLSTLQTKVKPVAFEKIYPVLTAQWGNNWEQQFSSFDVLPRNTASIAQVYKARLVSGEDVAVKVLLPGVAQTFEMDAKLLRWLGVALNRLVQGFDWEVVIEQFVAMTQQEFDLSVELVNIQAFHVVSQGKSPTNQVAIPQVFPELSGSEVLVMSWLEGEPLGEFLERSKGQRGNAMATANSDKKSTAADGATKVLSQLARLYVQQISQEGLFHADPHPGNLVVLPNQRLGLLDFGAVGRLTPEQRVAFNGLLAMLFGYQSPQFASQLKLAGFKGVDESVMARLSSVIRGSASAEDFSAVLETLMVELRVARVEIPDAFVAVIRVLITVSGYMSKYDLDFQYFQQSLTQQSISL